MENVLVVKIFQTLCGPMQLSLNLVNQMLKKGNKVTHQFQSVRGIILDVFDDVTVCHPFRNGRKMRVTHVSMKAEKFQDIGVRQLAPNDEHSTKQLEESARSA